MYKVVQSETDNLKLKIYILDQRFPNVYQYQMPANSGWFPGRALVISQGFYLAGILIFNSLKIELKVSLHPVKFLVPEKQQGLWSLREKY